MRALRILLPALFLVALIQPALPAEITATGKLVVEILLARASVVRNDAPYGTIRNDGKTLNNLVGVSTPIAKTVQVMGPGARGMNHRTAHDRQ